jgi:transposase
MDDEVGADARGHTSARMTGRIEVIARVSGRRFWSVEQKLTMLRDAFGPGGSVRGAMERHDVTSGLLYTWRRKAMAGLLMDRPSKALTQSAVDPGAYFAEVSIADPMATAPLLPSQLPPQFPPQFPTPSGQIAIELPSGIKLNVDALGRYRSASPRAGGVGTMIALPPTTKHPPRAVQAADNGASRCSRRRPQKALA